MVVALVGRMAGVEGGGEVTLSRAVGAILAVAGDMAEGTAGPTLSRAAGATNFESQSCHRAACRPGCAAFAW